MNEPGNASLFAKLDSGKRRSLNNGLETMTKQYESIELEIGTPSVIMAVPSIFDGVR